MKKIISLLLLLAIHQWLMAQNVGIGTTTPAFKLDVNGRMRVKTGTLNNISTSSGIWMEDYRDGTNRAFVGMQDSIRIGFYGAGTGGTGWGFNFNAVTGNVGIGITNALSALHVHSPDNTFNSYLRLTHQTSGTSFSDGAYMGLDGNNLLFRNSENGMMLFSNSGGDRLNISSAGNVGIGIGITTPQAKLHIDGGTNVGSLTGGYLQIGTYSARSLAFDNYQLQARNNGFPAELTLQNHGGGLQIGSGSAVVNITSAGKLNRNGITATADMLPICYGKIRSDGVIVSGTGNFSVSKPTGVEGVYNITIPGESMSANPDNYVIVISPTSIFNDLGADFVFTSSEIQTTGNVCKVETREFKVDYINRSLANNCNPFDCEYDVASYISNAPSARRADASFNFLVYKLY
jgi:hypothetical protein